MKKAYTIEKGSYWREMHSYEIWKLKKDAVNHLKEKGYRYDKKQDIYLDDSFEQWARVREIRIH